ncbi:unnamed protein product, partial [Urochloa humidicola]
PTPSPPSRALLLRLPADATRSNTVLVPAPQPRWGDPAKFHARLTRGEIRWQWISYPPGFYSGMGARVYRLSMELPQSRMDAGLLVHLLQPPLRPIC